MNKELHREASKKHYAKYKDKYNQRSKEQRLAGKKFLNETKANAGCLKCDETEPVCLDFHHLKGKDRGISEMAAGNRERLIKEIQKCVVLCSNCHRKVHAGLLKI